MKRYKALITAPITEKYISKLKEFCDVTIAGWAKTGNLLSEDELIMEVQGKDFLIVEFEKVTENVIRNSSNLKLIGCTRGNPVNIDVITASEYNIPVLYAPGRNANSAAEFTMGLILSELRHIGEAYYNLKSGKYLGQYSQDIYSMPEQNDVLWSVDGDSPYKVFKGFELAGRTLGLVGLGSIGRRVAEYAKAFDMEVIAFDPYYSAEAAKAIQVKLVELNDLFKRSDIVSIHCKVTSETKNLIGKEQLDLMKPNAYFVNTARASIVNQEALVDALINKRIAGAALDVYWYEPIPSNHPLLSMNNVILTPHIAGASEDVPSWQSKMIIEDIVKWIKGEIPDRIFKLV